MENEILVMGSFYPTPGKEYGAIYIHTRNKYYLSRGLRVTMLSFSAKEEYSFDGIEVITYEYYKKNRNKWRILVSHAPDHNAFSFLLKNHKNFEHIFYFIHGNEVLKRNDYYKWEFPYVKKHSIFGRMIQEVRDIFKVHMWKILFNKLSVKSDWIFVSEWMKNEFIKNVGLEENKNSKKLHIIYNGVALPFARETYEFETEKKYDFITIRGNFDSMKYGIDIVNEVAKKNPGYSFLILGKGRYFDFYEKAYNVEIKEGIFGHDEIIDYLSLSRCALMPTRHDAQGVMMCEMTTYGIPMVTSDISVCREVLDGFGNVFFIDNDRMELNVKEVLSTISKKIRKNDRFFIHNTFERELELFNMERQKYL